MYIEIFETIKYKGKYLEPGIVNINEKVAKDLVKNKIARETKKTSDTQRDQGSSGNESDRFERMDKDELVKTALEEFSVDMPLELSEEEIRKRLRELENERSDK